MTATGRHARPARLLRPPPRTHQMGRPGCHQRLPDRRQDADRGALERLLQRVAAAGNPGRRIRCRRFRRDLPLLQQHQALAGLVRGQQPEAVREVRRDGTDAHGRRPDASVLPRFVPLHPRAVAPPPAGPVGAGLRQRRAPGRARGRPASIAAFHLGRYFVASRIATVFRIAPCSARKASTRAGLCLLRLRSHQPIAFWMNHSRSGARRAAQPSMRSGSLPGRLHGRV